MKTSILIFLGILAATALLSQEKAPEAFDDLAAMVAGDTISVNVVENDWGMEGHTIILFNAYAGNGGTIDIIDSTITYASNFSFSGIDTVRYILQDEDNGLLSEAGYLIISVSNEGRAVLEVNNIGAFVQSFGLQFCDIGSGEYIPHFEVPKGSGRNSVFLFNLWLGGLDANNELHLAAERYKMSGSDFWNGPVCSTYENQQLIDYNKVWTFTRDQIEYHRQHWWEAGYEPIEPIASWPAHGDPSSGQAGNLAAFIDRNGDGIYQWEHGDYPAIRGDQGIFFMYNDDFAQHTESGGAPLKLEVHGQAYAYDCPDDSAFHNTIFFHYDIISRSGLAYHDFYAGSFFDFDLGYPWDDYMGCDTLLDAVYGYNGDEYDEHDYLFAFTSGYLDHPPAQAVVYLNKPMNSAIGFSNYGGVSGDPYGAEEIYNTMQGLWRDGTPITVGGNGSGGAEVTRYLFSGNPSAPDEWSEFSTGSNPSDRRAISAAGPFILNSYDTLSLDLAFVFACDYTGDNLSSVDVLKDRIEQVKWYFDNDSTPCGRAWTGSSEREQEPAGFQIYPNPASEWLMVEIPHTGLPYTIQDLAGRIIDHGTLVERSNRIELADLPNGVYILSVLEKQGWESRKLIKK